MINENELESEFYELQQISSKLSGIKIGDKVHHALKNRYSNIHPCIKLKVVEFITFADEDFRVLLKECEDDYINASHWEIPGVSTKIIATQAPLGSTISDFWKMVAEQNCSVIISLQKFDNRHIKYWECENVECISETEKEGTIIRELVFMGKKIIHLNYLGWPDHSVPLDLSLFSRFVILCRNMSKKYQGRIIIHCSAGMGRTGTLAAIFARLELGRDASIKNIVYELRKRRHKFLVVESIDQYRLIYQTVEAIPQMLKDEAA